MNYASSSVYGAQMQSSPIFDPFGIFGSLGKNYCIYFYIIAVIMFISFLISFGTMIMELVNKKYNKLHHSVSIVIIYFIMYLESRILYNMCLHSL